MVKPRRMIPKTAVAALAVTGCGDTGTTGGFGGFGETAGSGGAGGTGGASGELGVALNAFCMKLVECFPTYYETTEGCVADVACNQ